MHLLETLIILLNEQNNVFYFTYAIIHLESQRHLYTFCITLHVLQVTLQHHLNLQWHCFVTTSTLDLKPRSQHNKEHPSIPLESLLQYLPAVPRLPSFLFSLQYDGESFKYARSWLVNGFNFLFSGSRADLAPTVFILTFDAQSNFSLSFLPISLKNGITREQVLVVHVPDTPWQLQRMAKLFSIA